MDLKKSAQFVRRQFQLRNQTSQVFVSQHSGHFANVCQQMAQRFNKGGRLLVFGKGCWATDAQHVSALFARPVIDGKRVLPALDLSASPKSFVEHVLRPADMLMGFGPPQGDPEVHRLLERAAKMGALTIEWPGRVSDSEIPPASDDPFIHQEITGILCHTLWETVHVFFQHDEREDEVGPSSFLYPFLTRGSGVDPEDALADVSNAIVRKTEEDAALRQDFAGKSALELARAAKAVRRRIDAGGAIVAFGNGESHSAATDLALDCVEPPAGFEPVSAVALTMETAHVGAVAAGGPQDVAIGICASGKSKNVCAALTEASNRGMLTLCLVGCDGGDVLREGLADHLLLVHCDYIPRLQEIQTSIYHVFRMLLG